MARLQDFPTVTPTSSDKLLVVQSQSQGLVPYGSKLDSANPTGTGSLSINRASNTTIGSNSVAIGQGCTASNYQSYAEGYQTVSSGYQSHSEGRLTTASGAYSHAEGLSTTASGDNGSHSEGNTTTASGTSSHSEGIGTTANHSSQHVFGAYNVADASTAAATSRGNYVEIVGNGANASNRSNARTLDWSGNEVLAGGLKINGSEDVSSAPKRIPFSGTTSANANLPLYNITGYSPDTDIIVAIDARDADNTSTLYIGIPYQYTSTAYGRAYGAHFFSETLSGSAANKNVEGYIWVMKFRT